MIDVRIKIFFKIFKIFIFCLARLEVEIIKKLERNDLLCFYDYYISPHSTHRRKLALHVNPSSLAETKETDVDEDEHELPPAIEETIEEDISVTAEISHETMKLTEQPSIIDSLTEVNVKETENVLPKKEINLPKVKFLFIKSLFFF